MCVRYFDLLLGLLFDEYILTEQYSEFSMKFQYYVWRTMSL